MYCLLVKITIVTFEENSPDHQRPGPNKTGQKTQQTGGIYFEEENINNFDKYLAENYFRKIKWMTILTK